MKRAAAVTILIISHVATATIAVLWLNPFTPHRDDSALQIDSVRVEHRLDREGDPEFVVSFNDANYSTFDSKCEMVEIDQIHCRVRIRRLYIFPQPGTWYGDAGSGVIVSGKYLFARNPHATATVEFEEPDGRWVRGAQITLTPEEKRRLAAPPAIRPFVAPAK